MDKKTYNRKVKKEIQAAIAAKDLSKSENPVREFLSHVSALSRCTTRAEAEAVLERIPEGERERVKTEARWAFLKKKYFEQWQKRKEHEARRNGKFHLQKPRYRGRGAREGGKEQTKMGGEDHPQQGLF